MNREEKLEVFKEAVKLADSGKYTGWKNSVWLVKSGHKRAPELLEAISPDDSGCPVQVGSALEQHVARIADLIQNTIDLGKQTETWS